MAFKMNPKSPVLMKAMGYASPAKQAMKSGSSLTAAEKKEMNDKSVFGPDGKNVAKPPKSKSKSKHDKKKSLDKTGLKAGKDMTAAEKAKLKKYGKSPAKQTAKQKANLPKEIVDAIAAKSPAKQSLGNKNAEMGADGKMTIITANMAKNQKPVKPKKRKTFKKMKMEKVKSSSKKNLGNKNAEMGADGKMTIISANMVKNQKPMELKKDKLKDKKMKMEKVKSPAKQSKRTTRLKNKEAKETNKIIRGEKTSARKVNRLNNRLEVSKAKDKVKAVRKNQRAQKLKDKAAVLNNKAQG